MQFLLLTLQMPCLLYNQHYPHSARQNLQTMVSLRWPRKVPQYFPYPLLWAVPVEWLLHQCQCLPCPCWCCKCVFRLQPIVKLHPVGCCRPEPLQLLSVLIIFFHFFSFSSAYSLIGFSASSVYQCLRHKMRWFMRISIFKNYLETGSFV